MCPGRIERTQGKCLLRYAGRSVDLQPCSKNHPVIMCSRLLEREGPTLCSARSRWAGRLRGVQFYEVVKHVSQETMSKQSQPCGRAVVSFLVLHTLHVGNLNPRRARSWGEKEEDGSLHPDQVKVTKPEV